MNKHFKLLSLFFGLMVATTGFVACGGDDDDDPPAPQPQEQKGGDETPKTDSIPNPPANAFIGKWSNRKIVSEVETDNHGKVYAVVTNVYEFKSDMTFVFLGYDQTFYEKEGLSGETRRRQTGTYSFADDILTIDCQKNEVYNWIEETWFSQGEAWTVQYRTIVTSDSIILTPVNGREGVTYVKGELGEFIVPINPGGITTDDLVGVWNISSMDGGATYTFTKDKLTIASGDQEEYVMSYTLKDDVITYTTTDDVGTVKIDLLYDKSVLVWKVLQKNDNGDYYEFSHLMYKDGATINASVNDIQGTWHWYMYGNTEYVRAGLTIKDATFDLIITPWGQRYTGTFTYRNGYIILNTTNGYTSREEGSGDGWGEGNLDPTTLEGQWSTLDRENWMIWERMPFIANGTEAYGIVANLSALFVKK